MPIVKEIIGRPSAQNSLIVKLAEEVRSNGTAFDLLSASDSLNPPSYLQSDAFGYSSKEADRGLVDIVLKDQLNSSARYVHDLSAITLKTRGNLCRQN